MFLDLYYGLRDEGVPTSNALSSRCCRATSWCVVSWKRWLSKTNAMTAVAKQNKGRENPRMIQLELDDKDAATLVKVLNYYISELRMEIADTGRKEMRDTLKTEEAALKSLAEHLQSKL